MSSQIDRPWASGWTWGELIPTDFGGLFELRGCVCFARRLRHAPRRPTPTHTTISHTSRIHNTHTRHSHTHTHLTSLSLHHPHSHVTFAHTQHAHNIIHKTPQDASRPPPGCLQDTSKTSAHRLQLENICLSCFDCVVLQFLYDCVSHNMSTRSITMSSTNDVYSVCTLATVLTLANIHIPIVAWPGLVFTSIVIQKWCPCRLELVRKHIINTVWLPNGKRTRQSRPKMPPRRLQDAQGRHQDASKTPPRHLQDGFKSLRNRACFLPRFRDPIMTSKHAPRGIQDIYTCAERF